MASAVTRAKATVGRLAAGGAAKQMSIPETVSGPGTLKEMGNISKRLGITTAFVVTDEMIIKLGLAQPALDALEQAGIRYVVFGKVLPNPTYMQADEGWKLYTSEGCDGLIAIGGGSPMDCAKLIGARVSNPSRSWEAFQGLQVGTKKLPPFIAVPTTAGTGSEATVAAIITFPELRRKFTVADKALIPKVAVLDPTILEKLPPAITASTGMDALTHAVESYCSTWRSEFTGRYSLKAVEKIFKYLLRCFHDGSDLEAREGMLMASFEAGVAFTRANVGYVHAIAHTLGGLFHTPHGVGNAMVLPHVLKFYSDDEHCIHCYAQLAVAAGLDSTNSYTEHCNIDTARALGLRFVQTIEAMNEEMQIPSAVKELTSADVEDVAVRAMKEAHGNVYKFFEMPLKFMLDVGYPVPKWMSQAECEAIVRRLIPVLEPTVGVPIVDVAARSRL